MEVVKVLTLYFTVLRCINAAPPRYVSSAYFTRGIGEGVSLAHHSFLTIETGSIFNCAIFCLRNHQCVSWNFSRERRFCQLNNETARDFPDDVILEDGSWYFELKNKGSKSSSSIWEMTKTRNGSSTGLLSERITIETSFEKTAHSSTAPNETAQQHTVTRLITSRLPAVPTAEEPTNTANDEPFTINELSPPSTVGLPTVITSRIVTADRPTTVITTTAEESAMGTALYSTAIPTKVGDITSASRMTPSSSTTEWSSARQPTTSRPTTSVTTATGTTAAGTTERRPTTRDTITDVTTTTTRTTTRRPITRDTTTDVTTTTGTTTRRPTTRDATTDVTTTTETTTRQPATSIGVETTVESTTSLPTTDATTTIESTTTMRTSKAPTTQGLPTEVALDIPYVVRPTCYLDYVYATSLPENSVRYIQNDFGLFQVYCEQTTHAGGWTVIQRRVDDTISFERGWLEYKDGFGDLNTNFWLGLDKIASLCPSRNCELLLLATDAGDQEREAWYNGFGVEGTDYSVYLAGYTAGTAGDSMAVSQLTPFSTFDNDQDSSSDNCASVRRGGWWFSGVGCGLSSPNGVYYYPGDHSHSDGILWGSWNGISSSMKRMEMRVRDTNVW